jgi:hypothetical protein
VLRRTGRPEQAGELYTRCLRLLEASVPADHPVLRDVRHNHAVLLRT